MATNEWQNLSPDAKADLLRQELDAFLETERKNLVVRQERYSALEKRLDQLEEAWKQIILRLGLLEGKNSE